MTPSTGNEVLLDGIVYRIGNNDATVMRCELLIETTLTIADMVEGRRVMHIADNAFQCTNLQKVILPGTCRFIGESAFALCPDLVEVKIKNLPLMAGIHFSSHAFAGCKNLKTVDAQNGWLWLDEGTFVGCENLEIVTGKLFRTRDNAFRDCPKLLGLITAPHAQLAAKTFGNSQPHTLVIEGAMSRPSKNMFRRLKNTKIVCNDLFPFWDLVYEGYNIQLIEVP